MLFNQNFTLKEEGFSSIYGDCYNTFTHSVIFNGSYYQILMDNGNNDNPLIYIEQITELGVREVVENPIVLNTTNHNKSINNPQIETTDNMNNYQKVQTTLVNVNNSITYIGTGTTIKCSAFN
jgi:hypothetical protein